MLIAEQQLNFIYPGQERGSSALHLSQRRKRGSEPMTGQTKTRKAEPGREEEVAAKKGAVSGGEGMCVTKVRAMVGITESSQ